MFRLSQACDRVVIGECQNLDAGRGRARHEFMGRQ
jgi:hypothetical protein